MRHWTKTVPALAVLLALVLCATAQAQPTKDDLTRWKQEEQACISQCPKFPRYGGLETDEQYKARIQAENAYNQCYLKCTREYQNKVRIPFEPADDGSKEYYKRNEDLYQ